ncbi:MAG: class I SAM-dependent methyltransferase [Bryobacteraceae bacterium]
MSAEIASRLSSYYRWHSRIYDSTRWTFLFGRGELIRRAAGTAPATILEVGCGTGRNLAELGRVFPNAEILGVDCSAEMLAIARRKTSSFGGRVSLIRGLYSEPLSRGGGFDLIVASYCLSMVNPGYEDVLRLCRADASPTGRIAIVDFHDTPSPWFRQWMSRNHVRLDGQILATLEKDNPLRPLHRRIHSAYGGLWQWFIWIGGARSGN